MKVGVCFGNVNTDVRSEHGYDSCVAARLVHAWAQAAGDPGAGAASWFWSGTPAGIAETFRGIDQLFPDSDETPAGSVHELQTDYDQFVNYKGVENNAELDDQIRNFISEGYVGTCDSLKLLAKIVGGAPILNKIGCVTKIRAGVRKDRVILDAKQSRVSKVAGLPKRVELPRMVDIIFEALELMADLTGDEALEAFILDFSNAYWTMPLHRREWRYFCAKWKGFYFWWKRTAQGSRGAGLSWATFISLIMRITQGVIGKDRVVRRERLDQRASGGLSYR